MRVACKLLLGLALLQGAAYAADEPKIEVVDGKISITAQAVPLGRFLSMFDKAMGWKSEVKPGLENRNISVQFTGLSFNDAIRKIFQGQPYNYVVIQGKGIKVDLPPAGSTPTSTAADSSSFTTTTSPQPFSSNSFNAPIPPPVQVIPNNNPPTASSIFGGPLPAAPNNNPAANPSAPLSGPGVMPPPMGTTMGTNPMVTPTSGPYANGTVIPPPSQPAAPGTLPGAMPGAAPGTIK